MAQLHHALHGLAHIGAGPAELLGYLNVMACALPSSTLASACCALYDPADRRLRVANAGHPSPVLVAGGHVAITGNLKSVMQESASTAVSFVRSRAAQLGLDPPLYRLKDEGPDHEKRFLAEVALAGVHGVGEGRSKKQAERRAAQDAIAQLQRGDQAAPAKRDA